MTYEEIKENYPIGKVLYEQVDVIKRSLVFYTPDDLECYKREYNKVEITSSLTCNCYIYNKFTILVEGWVYDGKEWMPAEKTGDGWEIYTEEELQEWKELQAKNRLLEETNGI